MACQPERDRIRAVHVADRRAVEPGGKAQDRLFVVLVGVAHAALRTQVGRDRDRGMFHQVAADAAPVRHDGDRQGREVGPRADARAHQHGRSVDGAGRDDNVGGRDDFPAFSAAGGPQYGADGAPALEDDPLGQPAGHDAQVGPAPHLGREIAHRGRHPLARLADHRRGREDAGLPRPILVGAARVAHGGERLGHARHEGRHAVAV